MPRGFPAFPCPASRINRSPGPNKLSPGSCSTYMRLASPRRRMSPFSSSRRTTVQQISQKDQIQGLSEGHVHSLHRMSSAYIYVSKPLFALVLLKYSGDPRRGTLRIESANLESNLRRRRRQWFPRNHVRPVRRHIHKRRHDHRHLLHVRFLHPLVQIHIRNGASARRSPSDPG